MNIKQAKQEIKDAVRAYLAKTPEGDYRIAPVRQRPMLLIGPPGIGKTQIMEQIAKECEIGLVSYTITHHTRQSAVGLPFIRKDTFGGKEVSITEYTMSEIIASVYEKMRETGLKEGILFIDEINCVSETLAPTMLQFLQCKTFGNQAVPEGWIIVAAGNPPEYNKSVREFDMVTLDRVRRMRIEADFSVWKEYAVKRHIHPALLTYLDLRPANFYVVENDVDGMQFVTARGWEDLSSLMKVYEELGITLTEESIREYLAHDDVAKDVAAYIDLYKKYEDHYGIPEILEGKVTTSIYERLFRASFDEKISVVHLVLSGLHTSFEAVHNWKKITDKWFAFLKQYRSCVQSRRRRRHFVKNRDFWKKTRNTFWKNLARSYVELVHRQKMSWEKRRKKFLISHADHLQRQWKNWKCGSRRHLKNWSMRLILSRQHLQTDRNLSCL